MIACKKEELPPDLKIDQNYKVISPNQDGIQDELILSSNIKSKNFIKYWEIQILNEKREMVYYKRSKGERLQTLQKKLFIKKENVEIPDSITWDGKNMYGKVQPDGKYIIKFIIMDHLKFVYDSEKILPLYVYIDTKPPVAENNTDLKLFSPNGDGNKDQLTVSLKITPDDLEKTYSDVAGNDWTIDVLNNQSETINQFKYNDINGYTKDFIWGGKDSSGNLVKDGFYSLKISGTDKGGNYYEEIIPNISVDTKEDPVEVIVKEGVFSPNNDKVKDTISFNTKVQDNKNTESWKLLILDKNNKTIREYNGSGALPDTLNWDGKTDEKDVAPEGKYYSKISVQYKNGNISTAESSSFLLDITPPEASMSANLEVISPDNNSLKDDVIIKQDVSDEKTEWNATIKDTNNKTILEYTWKRNIPKELKWDGKDHDGNVLPDGNYFYQLSNTDLAGNTFKSPKQKITLFTAKSEFNITLANKVISPNNDGILDSQEITFNITEDSDNYITDYLIEIKDNNESIVYSEQKRDTVPVNYTWDGMNGEKKAVEDGDYKVFLTINTFYGVTTTLGSDAFSVDLTPPDIEITYEPKIFSPDGDGVDETITLNFTKAYDKSGIKEWKVLIFNPYTEKEFISYSGVGQPTKSIIWNGISSKGDHVGSVEDYPLTVVSTDIAGNSSNKKLAPVMTDILVEKLPDGRLKIRISNIRFKPNRAVMTDDRKNIQILERLSLALKKFPHHTIGLVGYANEYRKGLNEKTAQKLSEQRASTIQRELEKRGISRSRLSTKGKGFADPIIPLREDMTEDERKQMAINRRVEFYLSK
jgi:flagellar hook assembly protein FlgD/outer membrane protein OmpA-like peptidoglycan-associated protein